VTVAGNVYSGDFAGWGGPARYVYHDVAPLKGWAGPVDRRPSHQSDVPKSVLKSGPSMSSTLKAAADAIPQGMV